MIAFMIWLPNFKIKMNKNLIMKLILIGYLIKEVIIDYYGEYL